MGERELSSIAVLAELGDSIDAHLHAPPAIQAKSIHPKESALAHQLLQELDVLGVSYMADHDITVEADTFLLQDALLGAGRRRRTVMRDDRNAGGAMCASDSPQTLLLKRNDLANVGRSLSVCRYFDRSDLDPG